MTLSSLIGSFVVLCKVYLYPNLDCDGKFECSGHCIDFNEVCDGYDDCYDYSDEQDCKYGPIIASILVFIP